MCKCWPVAPVGEYPGLGQQQAAVWPETKPALSAGGTAGPPPLRAACLSQSVVGSSRMQMFAERRERAQNGPDGPLLFTHRQEYCCLCDPPALTLNGAPYASNHGVTAFCENAVTLKTCTHTGICTHLWKPMCAHKCT